MTDDEREIVKIMASEIDRAQECLVELCFRLGQDDLADAYADVVNRNVREFRAVAQRLGWEQGQ